MAIKISSLEAAQVEIERLTKQACDYSVVYEECGTYKYRRRVNVRADSREAALKIANLWSEREDPHGYSFERTDSDTY